MILTIRTDKRESEIGLFDSEGTQLAYKTWQAHRELGQTIHKVIKQLLGSLEKDWVDVDGIIFYEGPGSFTGLRIGASVANALTSANNINVSNQSGDEWIQKGVESLQKSGEEIALPEYGSHVYTTKPKK